MADLAGPVKFKFDDAMLNPDSKLERAKMLAMQMNNLEIKDGAGEPATWYARENPAESNQVILMAAAEDYDSAEDIAHFIYISGLVEGDHDVTIFASPAPNPEKPDEGVFYTVAVMPEKIERSTLAKLISKQRYAAPERPDITFN